jgi:hypothetical protein
MAAAALLISGAYKEEVLVPVFVRKELFFGRIIFCASPRCFLIFFLI